MCSKRNESYAKKVIERNKKIYIDSSALLNTARLASFIDNFKDIFIANNQRIIIIPAVCYELARHLDSDDSRKSQATMQAFELISANKEIFMVENNDLQESDLKTAFADKTLYEVLVHDRDNFSQLLITNDIPQSIDVLNQNELKSFWGRRVWVCKIDSTGSLKQLSDFEGPAYSKAKSNVLIKQKSTAEVKKTKEKKSSSSQKTKTTPVSLENSSITDDNCDSLIKWIYCISGATVGFCIGKWGRSMLNVLCAL